MTAVCFEETVEDATPRAPLPRDDTAPLASVDLLSIVAHDLRNPLNVIANSGALLAEEDGLPAADRRRMVEMMRHAVQQMTRLIDDLLDATRLHAGRLTLVFSAVDARHIVRLAEDMCRQDAVARGITLRTVLPDRACRLRADEGRLLQALGNILGNALKFTPAGGSVTVSLDADGGEAVFSVADTGPGLTPTQAEHLFDRFWQARPGDRRGIGLGLTITKGIIDAHCGRIWVNTKPGAGSTFFLALPMRGD
jgi:signal transduction histidine kinase